VTALATRFAELYRFRELVLILVGRDLKVRYKRSVLGMFWSLLNPLLQMGVYTLVFATIMRVNMPRYPVFLLSGLLPWMLISTAAVSSVSLLTNQGLIRKVAAPQAVYPLAVVGSKLVDVVLSLVPLAVLTIALGSPPGLSWLFVVPGMVIAVAFTAGLAMLFSSLTVFFRDLKHLVDILFQIWFYLTPVFYPYAFLEGLDNRWVRLLLDLNPATPIIRCFQMALYENRFPPTAWVTSAAIIAVATLLIGFVAFTRAEPRHIHHL
jgi:ABC-type polysaccharide/polyol phosphate export permease